MKISALAPWYGSKRTLAPKIIEQLGTHRAYWEPFCGSCSVLFAKERVTYETVNDLHDDLINLALVVQNPDTALDLYSRVARTLFHEDMLPFAKARLLAYRDNDVTADVERAYWYLILSWMGLNGIAGTCLRHTGTFAVRYSANGGNGATRWASVVDSIPDWHQRLIGVQILNRDAFDLLERIEDAPGTAIYVDPPYITKGSKYVHDFVPAGHDRLAGMLNRFIDARVVVSYYDHPILDAMYLSRGWFKMDCSMSKSMVNSGMRNEKGQGGLSGGSGSVVAHEVLLVNGPIIGGGLFQ